MLLCIIDIQYFLVVIAYYIRGCIVHAPNKLRGTRNGDAFGQEYFSYFFMIQNKRHNPGISSTRSSTTGATIVGTMVWIIGTTAAVGYNIHDRRKFFYKPNAT